jgi:hypothetical protein
VEYFLFYDFAFHQSIAWKIHHQWLAFLIEFGNLMQKSLIMAFGKQGQRTDAIKFLRDITH